MQLTYSLERTNIVQNPQKHPICTSKTWKVQSMQLPLLEFCPNYPSVLPYVHCWEGGEYWVSFKVNEKDPSDNILNSLREQANYPFQQVWPKLKCKITISRIARYCKILQYLRNSDYFLWIIVIPKDTIKLH